MELQYKLHGETITVWQPDGLSLEAHPLGFKPDPDNPFHFAAHPKKQGCIIIIERRDHYDGSMRLAEAWRQDKPGYAGQVYKESKTVFQGWCYSKEHFTQLLQLLRWMPATT